MSEKYTINGDTLTIHKDMTAEELNEAARGVKHIVNGSLKPIAVEIGGVLKMYIANTNEGAQREN